MTKTMTKTKVIAKKKIENSFSQVLFVEGKQYSVVRDFKNQKGIYVLNELGTETPVKNFKFDKMFIEA